MVDAFLQDLRYTFRTLGRTPSFTVFAILIAGLGIGASSTVFSLVNAVLLRPLPFRDPARLAWIANHDSSGLSGQTTQVGAMIDVLARNKSYEDIAAYFAFYGVGDINLTGQGEPERMSGVPVSQNFFPLLGVSPMLGRNFTPEECVFNGPHVVMLGYGVWQRRFASDHSIVGHTLTMNDTPTTVVGVLPPWFDFAGVFAPGSRIDLFTPFPLTAETNRWGNTLAMVGRLKPGATAESAQAEMTVLGQEITAAHPERNQFEGRVSMLSEHIGGRIRPALFVLAGAVGVVMLIVCANLSNLLLGRTAARQKEIAVRTALGAVRGRLIRQLLTESVTLSFCGAAFGLLLAFAGTRALSHLQAFNIALLGNVRTDPMSLVFTVGIALVTGLLFGLAPAIQVPASALHDALKESGRGTSGSRKTGWTRNSLVVSEIAFAFVLLVGAGLLMRSFLRVLDVNLGFQPERAAAMRVDPNRRGMKRAELNAYFDHILRRAKQVPGVTAAGLSDALPLGRNRSWSVFPKGKVYERGQAPGEFIRVVTDGYIGAMGIPLVAGRDFSEHDTPDTEGVAIINETMAKTLFPGENPIGQTLLRACNGGRKIVGVVGDVRHLTLEKGAGNELYLPMRQCGDFASIDMVVRTSQSPASLGNSLRSALREIEPSLSGNDFRVIQELVDKSVSPRKLVVYLLGGFALFALLLASLGIYAVISYSVTQRTQEIGIRMALGASAGHLQSRILSETLALAGIGMAIGAGASWMLSRSLESFLYGVTKTDPTTYVAMLTVLVAVAAAAGYIPARRASQIDPMTALRAE